MGSGSDATASRQPQRREHASPASIGGLLLQALLLPPALPTHLALGHAAGEEG